jgi:hypothetical protein
MTARMLVFSLIASSLPVFGVTAQDLNTWQRYTIIQQAKREQALRDSIDRVRLEQPGVARDRPGTLSRQVGANPSEIVECVDPATRRTTRRSAYDCATYNRLPAVARDRTAPLDTMNSVTRSVAPPTGRAGGLTNPSPPLSQPVPAGGPATVATAPLNPPVPTAVTVANVPPASVPLNRSQLPGTPTPRFLAAPAPSTPSRFNVPTAPTTPSATIRGIVNTVRVR